MIITQDLINEIRKFEIQEKAFLFYLRLRCMMHLSTLDKMLKASIRLKKLSYYKDFYKGYK